MGNETKNRILDTALTLFSERGYSGTSMNDIARSLGLTKAALYKHFESKEAIRIRLLDDVDRYYNERFGSKEHLPAVPDSPEELLSLTMDMAGFTIRDESIIKVRRMLALEQYRDERTRAIATRHFLKQPEEIFSALFKGMMEKGLFKKDDPAMLAFAFSAPISALVRLCDREPDKKKEVMEQIRAFAEHFIRTYGVTK